MLLTIFAEIFCLTRDIAVALFDLIGGSRRRHYRHTLVIRAPREAVWRAINAETTDFAGIIPTTAVTERIPGTDHYRTILKTDEHQQVMTWRQTLRREGAALHCDILADGTDAALIRGVDDRIGYQLTDAPGGARLTVFREVTPHGMMDAIGAPFGVRSGARLYKRMVEKDAGVRPTVLERLTGFGVVLSLLAFASFCYLMDFELAVVLAVVILLHELGHAFAMRLVGMEVKGIYLVPFFGGVAVPKTSFRTDFQNGFVSLMGPGFSLVPTFAFLIAYQSTGSSIMFKAAMISALINLINLVPVLPLDGGHVVTTVLTAVNRRLAHVVAWIGVTGGLIAACWFGAYIMGAVVLLAAIGLLFQAKGGDSDNSETQPAPMSSALAAALFAGLIVTAAGHAYAGYAAYATFKREKPPQSVALVVWD